MSDNTQKNKVAKNQPSRLFVLNGGFVTNRRLRAIVSGAGYQIKLGRPSAKDNVAVWGHSPTAHRGEAAAAKTKAGIIRIEDAFLRSLFPGRSGEPALGIVIDKTGIYFDATSPSDLEDLLKNHPFDDAVLLKRAREGMYRMQAAHLSKYCATSLTAPLPDAGYVLVVDQTKGDASIRLGGANSNHFKEMLFTAREENPYARIVIKSHPETNAGHRTGHFSEDDLDENMEIYDGNASPWSLMSGALSIYCVTSGMGFEAIMAGHRPHLFGQPFYAGWGLSEDRFPVQRRNRNLTKVQLFAGAMLLYPTWWNPFENQLGQFEDALAWAEANARAWREDNDGYTACNMRLWKRAPLQSFFGKFKRLKFTTPLKDTRSSRPILSWAGKTDDALLETAKAQKLRVLRVEDGFLRSRGLGADLVPPMSLVVDKNGIYYDPSGPSDLEVLLKNNTQEHIHRDERARRLIDKLIAMRLSKYNLAANPLPDLPVGHRILVPGQVEDDASIKLGTDTISTNLDLLVATRAAHPDAIIIYKPHPDVEAGLRQGKVSEETALLHADIVVNKGDPIALIDAVDEVWTMTSLLGFEALLRGKTVTCMGMPFYAGWGLTRDKMTVPKRRLKHISLEALVHATLIDYPRYFDPKTKQACSVEIVVDRLASGETHHRGIANRLLAKAQGALASYSWIWRR